jgi:hypothetical protein
VGLYIGTYKPKWSLWTSHYWDPPIDMLSKSSKNLSSRTRRNLVLQIHNQSMVNASLIHRTNNLKTTSPRHRKWCDFQKIPWHNTDECRSKQLFVAELKEKKPSPNSDNNKMRQTIDAEPTTTIVVETIQPEEPEHHEEGEHLFHS